MASSSNQDLPPTAAKILPLEHIVPEILSLIVSYLDPTALISLSQSSRGFRSFLQPTRDHLLQRLLSLELLPENNGRNGSTLPWYKNSDRTLFPEPFDVRGWEGIRYACAGCLKLRSHMHFDNHSIMRQGLRKPPLWSAEAFKLTDWEPHDVHSERSGKTLQRSQELKDEARKRNKVWRRIYHTYVTRIFWEGGFPNLFTPVREEAKEAEKHIFGTKRHQRLCLECAYDHGVWRRHTTSNYGTPERPLIKSRKRNCHTAFERYFPGLFADLIPPAEQCPRHTRLFSRDKEANTGTPWVLCMARCDHCSLFKELAEFRRDGASSYWQAERYHPWYHREDGRAWGDAGAVADPRTCNSCFAERHGPAALQRSLAAFALDLAEEALSGYWKFLSSGWFMILNGEAWKKIGGGPECEDFTAKAWRVLMTDQLSYGAQTKGVSGESIPRQVDMEALHAMHAEVANYIYHEAAQETRTKLEDVRLCTFRIWLEDYEKVEGAYRGFERVIGRIRESPELVLDHAMQMNAELRC